MTKSLIQAISHNDKDKVNELIKAGADVNQISYEEAEPNCDWTTPLHYAVYKGYKDIVELLVAQPDIIIDSRSEYGKTPLFHACDYNDLEIVKILLDKGANINHPTLLELPLLFRAIRNDNENMIKLLLDRGDKSLDANCKNCAGYTAIEWAFRNDCSVDIIKLLLDNGANINDYRGGLPLHYHKIPGFTKMLYEDYGFKDPTRLDIKKEFLYEQTTQKQTLLNNMCDDLNDLPYTHEQQTQYDTMQDMDTFMEFSFLC